MTVYYLYYINDKITKLKRLWLLDITTSHTFYYLLQHIYLKGEGTCFDGCLTEGRNLIKEIQFLSISNLWFEGENFTNYSHSCTSELDLWHHFLNLLRLSKSQLHDQTDEISNPLNFSRTACVPVFIFSINIGLLTIKNNHS